jgi:sulfur carrier protein ThiS
MEITFKLCGPLRKMILGHVDGELKLQVAQGATVSQAVEQIGLTDKVRMLLHNGKALLHDTALADGDRLTLIPPELAYNMYVATGFLSPTVREKIRQGGEE